MPLCLPCEQGPLESFLGVLRGMGHQVKIKDFPGRRVSAAAAQSAAAEAQAGDDPSRPGDSSSVDEGHQAQQRARQVQRPVTHVHVAGQLEGLRRKASIKVQVEDEVAAAAAHARPSSDAGNSSDEFTRLF